MWQWCNQITGKGRREIILFPHTMLLRNTDGAVKKNGLVSFPDNRLQKAFEHLLLSRTKGECYRYGVVFSMWWKCFCCWNTVFEKIHKICSAVLSPFAHAGAFRFSLGFIIMNETVRSLRKTWEREILWASCRVHMPMQGEFCGKMCWRISLIKNLFSLVGVFLVKVMGSLS